MLVSNSFDLWQRDAFFSAAEEVQESADILESAYRLWIRQKKDGLSSNDLDELRREVQTALGTAKWQLEEFEKAVRLSYGNCRDHSRMARHQQFLVAIESLITRVEDTLRDTLNEEGKQPFRWVNLDEDERDDLAMFLSGSETFTKSARNKIAKSSNSLTEENLCKKKDLDFAACSTSTSTASNMQGKGSPALKDDVVINMEQPTSLIELSAREALGTRGDMNCDADRTRSAKRTHISPNSGSLKIVIPNGDDNMSTMSTIEATPKVKGFKTSSLLQFRGISCINKLFTCSGGLNNRMQGSRRLQFEPFHATHTHFDAINFPVGTLFGSLKLKRDHAARSNTIDVSRFFHMIQRIYQHPMYQLPKAMLSDMIHICCLDCSAPTQ